MRMDTWGIFGKSLYSESKKDPCTHLISLSLFSLSAKQATALLTCNSLQTFTRGKLIQTTQTLTTFLSSFGCHLLDQQGPLFCFSRSSSSSCTVKCSWWAITWAFPTPSWLLPPGWDTFQCNLYIKKSVIDETFVCVLCDSSVLISGMDKLMRTSLGMASFLFPVHHSLIHIHTYMVGNE